MNVNLTVIRKGRPCDSSRSSRKQTGRKRERQGALCRRRCNSHARGRRAGRDCLLWQLSFTKMESMPCAAACVLNSPPGLLPDAAELGLGIDPQGKAVVEWRTPSPGEEHAAGGYCCQNGVPGRAALLLAAHARRPRPCTAGTLFPTSGTSAHINSHLYTTPQLWAGSIGTTWQGARGSFLCPQAQLLKAFQAGTGLMPKAASPKTPDRRVERACALLLYGQPAPSCWPQLSRT